jgi:hypothetical protein
LIFNETSVVKVFVVPREICPLNNVLPDASETNNQLFARVAVITASTPVPVDRVASSDGDASGVADVDGEAVTLDIGAGICGEDVFETII